MEENKNLYDNTASEESSDYFTGAESPDQEAPVDSSPVEVPAESAPDEAVAEEGAELFAQSESDEGMINAEEAAKEGNPAAGLEAEEVSPAAEKEAEEARLAAEREEEERLAAERKAEEERLAAQRKAEEERLAAQRKAEEEARIAAQKKAEEEARLAAQRKAEEEARLAAQRKAEEEARIAAEKKAAQEKAAAEKKALQEKKAAEKAAKKEARKEAREARKEAIKNWVPDSQFPNKLTIARICMIPLFVILILWVPKPLGNILSMIVFIIACLTDTADGYIARKYDYLSTFGKFMDPLADKLLVCSALICLVDLGRIESWIVIIIIAREFIISGFRLIAVEKGVVIAANIWGKVKTILQMVMVILMLGNFGGFLGAVSQITKWAALLFTILSLITYLYQNRHVLHDEVQKPEPDVNHPQGQIR